MTSLLLRSRVQAPLAAAAGAAEAVPDRLQSPGSPSHPDMSASPAVAAVVEAAVGVAEAAVPRNCR